MELARFSSEAFPDRERSSAIQDIWAPVTRIDLAPVDRRGFFVDAAAFVVPGLSIGWGRFSGYRAHRTRPLAADSADDLVFCLVTDAGWSARREGNEETFCDPGDVFLTVARDPSIARVPGSSNGVLNFAVPRAVLAPAVVDLDGASNAKLPSTPALRLMTNYVLALTREAEAMSPGAMAQCVAHLHDLAALALGADRDSAERAGKGGLRAARLAAIKADIAANLTRPELSIGWVAARHGISPQYVRMLFNGEATTFGDHVRSERLAHVHRQLGDPRLAGRAISTIVFESGFGDLSHFNRVFRARYGMTPSDVRAVALSAARDAAK